MTEFFPGQRWMSASEPELGLGTVVQAEYGRVQLLYPATGEMRLYAAESAPLQRVQFEVGQEVENHEGEKRVIASIREDDGVLVYCGEGWELPEPHLSDRISFQGPEDRLQGQQFDEIALFDLRRRALEIMHRWRKSPARGFVGGRIDLIPHQLYVAHEVCSRLAPRVLLSDEVGLGKTIEAGLIMHRLLATGRVSRIFILVPDSLLHQWLVEMLRKFNLWMNVFDEERCLAIEASDPEANPFLDDQLILCSLDFFSNNPSRAEQAKEAGWDLLVVDEAHHLEWSPDEASEEYQLVESLASEASSVLLLTATPEQLGPESHFARLRLLDPNRYSTLETIEADAERYLEIAPLASALSDGLNLNEEQKALLDVMPGLDADTMTSEALLSALLDRHGPGRVVFRNTRSAMSGFPKRVTHMEPLPTADAPGTWREQAAREFASDVGTGDLVESYNLHRDPRLVWLGELLKELGDEKVLLICRTCDKVLAIERAVSRHIPVKAGVFHENLTLLQRDRNAAWFAEEDGARLLICSEIGSEGRNFQFTHHLVLFDLPLHPELLEQRIGRLDRIGQRETINVHVPFLEGSPQEFLAKWYHEGLDAFKRNVQGGHSLFDEFGDELLELATADKNAVQDNEQFSKLVDATTKKQRRLADQFAQGRDRLLELNSFRPEAASELVESIREADLSSELETFMLEVFEHYGVRVEDFAERTYFLDGRGVTTESFPGLPKDGLVATFARAQALSREDIGLLTGDHPIVTGAMDLLLGSALGNCSFGLWRDATEKELLVEAIFVVETLAPSDLHADRFLPPTPLCMVVNQAKERVFSPLPDLEDGSLGALLENRKVSRQIIPATLRAAQRFAEEESETIIAEASNSMILQMQTEIRRLTALQKVNDHVRPQEIELVREQFRQLTEALEEARVRLDSLRVIWKGMPEDIDGF
ncbi:MAG: RNA polymerase-associated protein RapA [Opitutae bacterium]|nr:RNA polymerase-associated protein RapA [Opitutae bacterium]